MVQLHLKSLWQKAVSLQINPQTLSDQFLYVYPILYPILHTKHDFTIEERDYENEKWKQLWQKTAKMTKLIENGYNTSLHGYSPF